MTHSTTKPKHFAADFVFPGHPDKLCDAIADALPILVKGDEAGFMNKVHLLAPAPEDPAPRAALKKE